jgi:hypothetical protein
MALTNSLENTIDRPKVVAARQKMRMDTSALKPAPDAEQPESQRVSNLPKQARTRAGKLRLVTMDTLDARTASAQAARALIATLSAEIVKRNGSITALEQQAVTRIAILGAIVVDYETRWVTGEPIAMLEYLRVVNTQRQLLTAMGLKRDNNQPDEDDLGAREP